MNRIRHIIQRYDLIIFFILACAPVWVIVSLHITDTVGILLSTLAPTVAALVLIALTDGRTGFAALRRQVFIWRVKPIWMIAAIVVPTLCVLVPILLADAIAHDAYQPAPMTAANQAVLGGVFIFAFLEELGWMGFAMPRLIKGRPALVAALIVGLMQGVYHFPVLLLGGAPISIIALLLTTCAFRVLMTWIYLPTGGSVLVAALFHGMINVASSFVVAGIAPDYFNVLYSAGFVIAAVIIILATGHNPQRQPSLAVRSRVERSIVEQA